MTAWKAVAALAGCGIALVLAVGSHRHTRACDHPPVALDVVEVDVSGIVLDAPGATRALRPSALRVFPADADWTDATFPSVAGTMKRTSRGVRFQPRYPFASGERYRVVWRDPGRAPAPLTADFTVPAMGDGLTPALVSAYPTGDTLPENQLKIYLHFATPMDTRAPYEYIRLRDADTGEELDAVFHTMRGGLWDPTGTRLTIVFDPGRVKRGLTNHLTWGAPLVPGRRYRLVVDAGWPDASGRRLERSFEKSFTATTADRRRPDPAEWRIDPPPSGSRTPLTVRFDEPLDRALLETALQIVNDRGPVSGRPAIGHDERTWRFVPARDWAPGPHALVVACRLEDLAGNNLIRLFDRDLAAGDPTSAAGADCPTEVSFIPGGVSSATHHGGTTP